jgi:hypothetical protein
MPITILDYVKSVTGEKTIYTVEDFATAGVDTLGGCQICGATLAPYNAYPSTSGYWRCADCIGDSGFTTIEKFTAFDTGTGTGHDRPASTDYDILLLTCPACGDTENVREVWENAFACGECGAAWRL